jgi:hypothetical protein
MLRPPLGALAVAALALAACTQPPIALKDGAPQQSATSVRDWDNVAHQITAELTQRGMLLTPQPGVAPSPPPWGPYYIHAVTPGSSFLQEVGDTLKADITNRGGTIARVPDGAVVINLQVDYLKHGPRDQLPGGELTAIAVASGAGALISAMSPATTWASGGIAAGTLLGAAVLGDVYKSAYPVMNGEVIWRASIVSPQQVLMQVGAPLYVSAGDIPLYAGNVKLAQLTTPGVSTMVEARRMRYDP